VETILIIDSFDRLFNFASTVCAPRLENSLRVQGTAEGQELELSIHFMDTEVPANIPLPAGAMLEDALSPQTQLPNLHAGQTWTVPVCSPLLPNSPVEILEARVEAAESIRWNGRRHDTWRVVYRKDPGAGLSSDRAAQGTLWVARDEDGTVLKQQADLMGATITFVRLGDEQAATLKEKIRQRQPFVRSQWPDKTPWESTEDDATTDDPFSENAGT